MSELPDWERRLRWAAVCYPPEFDVMRPAPVEELKTRPEELEEFVAEFPEPCRAAVREQVAAAAPGTSMLDFMICVLSACPDEFREEAAEHAEESVEQMRELWEMARPMREFE